MENSPLNDLKDGLSKAKTNNDYFNIYNKTLSSIDYSNTMVLSEIDQKLACKENCEYCCYFKVEVSAFEVFQIYFYIENKYNIENKEKLISRLNEHTNQVNTVDYSELEKRNIKCPLLVNGKCSVYPVRPIGCRRHHSLDVSLCKKSFDNPTDLTIQNRYHMDLAELNSTLQISINKVYENAGFDKSNYELGTALKETIDNKASFKRWRNKKKAFTNAICVPNIEM